MSFISYAPNFEDVMLWRALRHVGTGFYIDAGSGGPDAGSITRALYERGWHGVNLEPSRAAHGALLTARPADINLQAVAGDSDADVTFYDADSADSTLDETRARASSAAGRAVVQRRLAQRTLSAVCAEYAAGDIHVMRLGATGTAPGALAGLDLARWRPWILLLARPHAAGAQLAAAGYQLAYDDGISHFYVAAEHAELLAAFAAPPSSHDDFVLRPDHPYAWPLAEWRRQVAALQSQVEAEQQNAQAARDWSEARLVERDAEHAAALAQAALREQQQALREQEQAAREQELTARAAALEAALAESAARAEQADHSFRERAGAYEASIHALLHSSSWRITRPLRAASFHAQRLRAFLRTIAPRLRGAGRRLRGAFAGLLRGVVRRTVRAVMARPALSYFVRSQVGRHPRLVSWLRVTVQRTQAVPATATAAAMEIATDPDHLPSSARQVLDDLRRAIKGTRPQ